MHRPMTPRPVAWGWGRIGAVLQSTRTDVSASRSRLQRSTVHGELAVVVHYPTRQVFDQLLANGAVLTLPPPIPVQRSHGFTRPTTPPWCRVRATHREAVIPSDLLSPRSLRLARKSRRR